MIAVFHPSVHSDAGGAGYGLCLFGVQQRGRLQQGDDTSPPPKKIGTLIKTIGLMKNEYITFVIATFSV